MPSSGETLKGLHFRGLTAQALSDIFRSRPVHLRAGRGGAFPVSRTNSFHHTHAMIHAASDSSGQGERSPELGSADGPGRAVSRKGVGAQAAAAPGCGATIAAFGVGALFLVAAAGIATVIRLPQSALLLLTQVGLIAGVAAFLYLAGYDLRAAFRLNQVDNAVYSRAVLLGVALLLANLAATLLLGPSIRDLQLVTAGPGLTERIILALTVVLIAPAIEESLFRGLLQGALEARARPWTAIALAAVPFALLHWWPALIFFFFWSLPVGWLTWRTASIGPGLVVHAINNVVGLAGLVSAGPIDPEALERTPGQVGVALMILPAAALWVLWLCLRIDKVLGRSESESKSEEAAV